MQGSVGEYKVYRRRWAGLLVLMVMNIVISWGWLSFAPVSNYSQEYFGLSSMTPINWLSTVAFFTYVVISPVVPRIVNKRGIRAAVWISSLLTLLGFWVRYIGVKVGKGGFGLVMLGQIFIGFAQPFVLNIPTYYSDLWFTSNARVSATALASLANPFGAAIGQLVNPILATKASEIPQMVLITAIVATVPAIFALLIPAKPPSPPCVSSMEKKLPLKEALKVVARSKNFWLIFLMESFAVYLGYFNAYSSLINQIYEPYGYSTDQAGYIGAVLIVAGLVAAAILSPILDRRHAFLTAIRVQVPLIGLAFIAIIFTPTSPPNLVGPMVVNAILGAASFSLLPVSLEYCVEQTHPVSPEVTSTILWMGGQFLGGIFLIIMDAMRDKEPGGSAGRPERNMWAALVFEGVGAALVIPAAFFVKKRKAGRGRVEADQEAARAAAARRAE
ncbi:MFS general substrate transporter [Terfezia boudieri ATCC MYA-4762]|uniref:MFS general substrate transporter n=1 Tax=Terfezia boudieri ATCC MYA-4762 TaxID=1051890 RepID=A0A3N4LBJ6_9PEZI|nr:MFS general substrate transporter [Terfezia boudieri ATCC MYA-4762]